MLEKYKNLKHSMAITYSKKLIIKFRQLARIYLIFLVERSIWEKNETSDTVRRWSSNSFIHVISYAQFFAYYFSNRIPLFRYISHFYCVIMYHISSNFDCRNFCNSPYVLLLIFMHFSSQFLRWITYMKKDYMNNKIRLYRNYDRLE